MTAPTVQFIDMTPRAFLASLTPPLAVNHEGARGRFSKEGVAALATARADGFLFIGDAGHPKTEVKAPKAPKADKPKVSLVKAPKADAPATVPAQSAAPAVEVNPKEVRAWAKANGHEVGERGRLHGTVVSAFLAAGGKAVGPKAKPAAAPKPERVRKQTVAYGRIPRRKSDPAYLTEPIIGVEQCGTCRKGIAYCPCAGGPTLPKQYGAGPTVFALANVPSVAQAKGEVTA
jgi:hypothetical protein